MPVLFLTDVDRAAFSTFPTEVPEEDISAYFTLSEADKAVIPKATNEANRIGFAVQLGILRYLGFCPDDLSTVPASVIRYVAGQLGVPPETVALYGGREQTRTDHLREIQRYLGFRKAGTPELNALSSWLVGQALEHDQPKFLLRAACEKLQQEQVVRPGISILERLVATARAQADDETFARLSPVLSSEIQTLLDGLLVVDKRTNRTPVTWLSQPAVSNTAPAILVQLEKLHYIRQLPIAGVDLSVLSPNRVKLLAQLGKRSTNQALQRAPERRRYPILLAFLYQALRDLTDEIIDMYCQCLHDAYRGARHDLEAFKKDAYKSANEKVYILEELSGLVLDEKISDERLREVIYRYFPPDRLQSVVAECRDIARPLQDHYYDFLATRYSYIRQFAPEVLSTFSFQANTKAACLLTAIKVLRQMNANNQKKLPLDAPLDFLPADWKSYVIDRRGQVDRRYWELCVLWELRNRLSSGDIFLPESSKYASPEQYIMPPEVWAAKKAQILPQLKVTAASGEEWLAQREEELSVLCQKAEETLRGGGPIRIEEGKLIVSPRTTEALPESAVKLQEEVTRRLPSVDLSDVLTEVHSWTRAADHFRHVAGTEPRAKEALSYIFAIIRAHSHNMGLSQMAESAGLSYDTFAWYENWYLREETLKDAFSEIVNFQYRQPFSQYWGNGTLSSSDGQRFPVSVKTKNATALPRYFSYGKGLQHYTWTSDQFSQYGAKIAPATVRDALLVLDAILDNETDLPLLEHTTDTSGYTELVFALFHLLGMQFSPRLRDLSDQTLYRIRRDGAVSRLL